MIKETRVIAECNADTLLINMLLKTDVVHGANNDQVATIMIKSPANKLAIGVIDNDKKKPEYFKEFKIQDHKQELHFSIHKHPKRKHYFIIIDKAHEDFVLKSANEANLTQEKYAKFFNMNYIKSISKNIYVSKNVEYKNFLIAIIQKNPPPIKELRQFITELLS